MYKKLMQFLKDEDGVTSVEYAVMAALIALVVIVGAKVLGENTNATFNDVAEVIPGRPTEWSKWGNGEHPELYLVYECSSFPFTKCQFELIELFGLKIIKIGCCNYG